jgi:nitrate reductase beta subunit
MRRLLSAHRRERSRALPRRSANRNALHVGLRRQDSFARTEPNGYYIPPRWVPRGYLYQMFGPGVEQAIEQYSCPDRELLAVLQLFRAQRQILFKFKIEKGPKVAEIPVRLPSGEERVQELFNDTVIGFNKFGKEVVRVTIDEPVFERPKEKHANSI